MEDAYLIDDSKIDITKGLYAVLDSKGNLVAQGDVAGDVLRMARAKGVKVPVLVNLEITRDRTYVF